MSGESYRTRSVVTVAFTQRVSQGHACCTTGQRLFLFLAESHAAAWLDCLFFIPSSVSGHLGCFYLLTSVNHAAAHFRIQRLVRTPVFRPSGCVPGSGTAGLGGSFVSDIVQQLPGSPSPPATSEAPCLHTRQRWSFSVSLITAPSGCDVVSHCGFQVRFPNG